MKKIMLRTFASLIIVASAFTMNVFAKGWTTDGSDWYFYDSDEILVTSSIKASGDDKYYLDENGFMVRDYLLEDYNDSVYYFDEDGKMVTNTWVAVDTTQVQNSMDNAPSIYLYYFGANGKAYQGQSGSPAKKTIDGKKYLFNENGQMLSGWIDESGNRFDYLNTEEDPFVGYCYYAGDETDGVLREGWSSYEDGSVDDKYYKKEVLWFYFKPGTCKKECSTSDDEFKTRVINGKKYGFDINGVMIQGWESDMIPSMTDTKNYFSESMLEDERGRMYKKEWIYAIPSELMSKTLDATDKVSSDRSNANDHDEEIQRWFYALSSGDIVKNSMRKINGAYFVFNEVGIMKHGLCILEKGTNKFVDCVDLEKTDGKDFIISRRYISLESYSAASEYQMFDDKNQVLFYFETNEQASDFGLRKVGNRTVAFADDDYIFTSTNQGQNEGLKKKKYYQAGILLKAEKSLGLGLVFEGYATTSDALSVDIKPEYTKAGYNKGAHPDTSHGNDPTHYIVDNSVDYCTSESVYPVFKVVDGNGNRVKKSNTYVKDKAGHYWLIGPGSTLIKIFDIPIKYDKKLNWWFFKSELQSGSKIITTWIPFADSPGLNPASVSTADTYGKECYLDRSKPADKSNTYETYIDDSYATNFRFTD